MTTATHKCPVVPLLQCGMVHEAKGTPQLIPWEINSLSQDKERQITNIIMVQSVLVALH